MGRRDPQMDQRQTRGMGLTVWHVAEKKHQIHSVSAFSSFMINYRIDHMSEMLAQLKRNGAEIWKGPESRQHTAPRRRRERRSMRA